MRSFQYMMKGLQTYAQVRGKVIALPPAPERMTVRIERIGKGAMLSDSSPASIGRHRVIAPVARDATPLPPPSLPPTAAKQGDGAIDLSGFVRPERHLLQRARKAWRESFTFLCVAPFLPEFDHAALLSSFADVHAAFPQARLRLIGPQTDAASHAKVLGDVEASSLGHAIEMHFYDGPHGLSRHLAAVQAYVLPTVRAQPDPSIIHAAYFGLPMVLIDAAESRAAIQGGACGILVPPPASEAALGEAMKRIMSDYEALMDRGFEGQAWAEAQASGHHEATTTTRVGTSGTTSPQ